MVFFFYGPNTFASRRKMGDMVDAYIKKNGSNFGIERVEGPGSNYDTIVGMLQASPFLANSRLVIIENLGANKTVAEKVVGVMDTVPDSTVAVFYESDVDQRTSYFKTMSKHPAVKAVKFDKLSLPQLQAWSKREVARLGGTIDGRALNLLLDMVGDDQWRLEQELNKLVNYEPAVTVDNVKSLVAQSNTETIFDLVEAMSSGNTKQALSTYRALIGERTNEVYILTMVTWQLRNLLLAKTSGLSNSAQLAKAAGLSPYVAGKALQKQRTMSEEMLKAAYIEAVETDYKIKSGQGDPEQLVEDLIYTVAVATKG